MNDVHVDSSWLKGEWCARGQLMGEEWGVKVQFPNCDESSKGSRLLTSCWWLIARYKVQWRHTCLRKHILSLPVKSDWWARGRWVITVYITRMMKSIAQYFKMWWLIPVYEIRCQVWLTRFSLRVIGQAYFDLTIYLLKQKNERKKEKAKKNQETVPSWYLVTLFVLTRFFSSTYPSVLNIR